MEYTQDQINVMTAEQLKAAILELQGQTTENAAVTPAQEVNVASTMTAPDAEQVDETKTPVQTDIEKIEAHIAVLKQDDEALYTDAIKSLEAKRDRLVAEAKADAQQAEAEVKTFWQQYGNGITKVAEFVLLGYIAGRLAGVL